MLDAKHTSQSPWRSSWSYAALVGAAALSACVLFEPKGGSNDAKNAQAVALFTEQVAIPESKSWTAESGIDQSALGTLNPVFFDPAKSPLRFPGARIKFNLFEGVTFYADVEKVHSAGNSHIVSKGKVDGVEDGTFLISTLGGLLNGVVRLGSLGNFNVTFTEGGEYRVSRLNDYEHDVAELADLSEGGVPLAKFAAQSPLRKKSGAVRVDVAVVYDSAARTAAGSDSAIRANIVASIDEANDVYENSGVDLVLNLVDTTLLTLTVSDTADSALARVKRDTTSGTYKIVHTIRAATSADIVIFVHDAFAGSVAGATTTLTKVSTTGKANAFIVLAETALDLGQYGIAKTVAYNMGCAPDAKSAKKTKGYDTYSRGWTFKGKDKIAYRTMEAGGTGTVIPYVSNPAVVYQQKPAGAKAADNAKTLRITGPLVAAYIGTDEAAELEISFPEDNSSFGGSNLKITVDATDDNGIDSVVFFDSTGGVLTNLGKDSTSAYTLFATGLDSGDHKIIAKAYDKGGNTSTSDTIHVTMGEENAPSGFSEQYLGHSGLNGTTSTDDDGEVTVTSSGFGAATHDDMQFLYAALPLNGRVFATVKSVTENSGKARAGLLVRDSLNRTAKMAFLSYGNDSTIELTTRAAYGKAAVTKILKVNKSSVVTGERRFLFVRKSNFVTMFQSDGYGWTYLSKANFGGKGTAYMGAAFASGDSTITDTAVFYNVTTDTSGNNPPTLVVTGISNDTTIGSTDSVTINATVTDQDGAKDIKAIKIFGYRGDSTFLLGADSTKPYSKKVGMRKGLSKILVYAYDASDSSGAEFEVNGLGQAPEFVSNGGDSTATIHLVEGDSTVIDTLAKDAGDTLTFAKVGGADSSDFAVSTTTGAINFKFVPQQDSALDADSNNTYIVKVSVTDGDFTRYQTVTVKIHSAPVITSFDSSASVVDTVDENTTAVHTITSSDADSDTRVYSISGGADSAKFAINSSSGALTFVTAPDYEEPADANTNNDYVVKVRVADDATYDEMTLTVTVDNVVDAQTDTLAASIDAWGQGKDSAAVNHGSSTTLLVRNAGTDTTNSFRSVLKFALTTIDSATSATLRLFGASSDYNDTVKVVVKTFGDTTYTEMGVDYGDMVDSVMTTSIDTLNVVQTSNQWYSVNVSTVVTAAVSAGKNAISFALVGQDSTTTKATFYSKETSGTVSDPKLILNHLK